MRLNLLYVCNTDTPDLNEVKQQHGRV